MSCAIDGCERASRSRGWCGMHYQRWQRTGRPDAARRDAAADLDELRHLLDCGVAPADALSRLSWTAVAASAAARRAGRVDLARVAERLVRSESRAA